MTLEHPEVNRASGEDGMKRRVQMMIRQVRAVIVVAATLLVSLNLHAKTKFVTPEASYNFRCVGPTLNLSAISFSLPVSRSSVATGAVRAGMGRLATSTLTIDFPVDKAYSTLISQIARGEHYSSCTLVETVVTSAGPGSAASASTLSWTFSQMTPTTMTVIWRDPSIPGSASAAAAGADSPTSELQATFTFSEVRFDDESGNHTTGSVDSWTQTQ
jgi:hypothetical protein